MNSTRDAWENNQAKSKRKDEWIKEAASLISLYKSRLYFKHEKKLADDLIEEVRKDFKNENNIVRDN